jgi:hypothetical protein
MILTVTVTVGTQRCNISLNVLFTPCFAFYSVEDSIVAQLMKFIISITSVTNLKEVRKPHVGYGQNSWDSTPSRDKRFFYTPQHPDHIWVHPYSYTLGTGASFPKVTSCKVKNGRAVFLSAMCLHGMMLN